MTDVRRAECRGVRSSCDRDRVTTETSEASEPTEALREGDRSVTRVPLGHGRFALVDKADFERVNEITWHRVTRHKTEYAQGTLENKKIYLHRFVMDAVVGQQIDHANGDGLDCRRSNLRVATHGQNQQNRSVRRDCKSGFKGVQWEARTGRWRARIIVARKVIRLGRHATSEEAARAYDNAALEHFGEFALLNFR